MLYSDGSCYDRNWNIIIHGLRITGFHSVLWYGKSGLLRLPDKLRDDATGGTS